MPAVDLDVGRHIRAVHRFATVAMDTWVNVQLLSDHPREQAEASAEHALNWFASVEHVCSRFEPSSEVMRLAHQPERSVPVSTLLREAIAFALGLAQLTDGAFDPTIGAVLEERGFNRNYRTGAEVRSGLSGSPATFRDVRVDRRASRITLRRPLVLDLGAVAKGLAIDLAARELGRFSDFCIEAGGDLYARGHNAVGAPWQIGIQHPRSNGLLARTLAVTDAAVCTSGDYERPAPEGVGGHHVLDARKGHSPDEVASVTVVAPTAMMADGLSTAAMILGRERGLRLLEQEGVAGLLLSSDGTAHTTNGFGAFG